MIIKVIYHDKKHLVDFSLEAEGKYKGDYFYSKQDIELQNNFWMIFNENIKKYNLSHLHGEINATFDTNFLKNNTKWLN